MKVKSKILIVDDIEINRTILKKSFTDEYDILEASDGKQALELIEENKKNLVVILLDIVMPVVDGFEVLEELNRKKLIDKIPVILITGDKSSDSELRGFNLGVMDLIAKPFNPLVVKKRVDNAIELYNHKRNLEKMVKKQTDKIEKQTKKLRKQKDQLIDTLSTVVEFRDLESEMHVQRIQEFTLALLEIMSKMYPEYKLSEKRIESITTAAMLHDVGKIAVPDNILLKPGKLTKDEFDIIKTHTTKGCDIINRIAFVDDKDLFRDCYDICRYHHEKYDGRGYPDGLVGEAIPISAQVVSIADIYDALVSDRVYKAAYSKDKAFDMIVSGECGVFNPKLVECFKKAKPKLEKLADKLVSK